MELLSISDKACTVAYFDGSERAASKLSLMTRLRLQAHRFLKRNDRGSVCDEIPPSKLRVLPKNRVPQKGFTIRSLSLYACLIEGQEICPRVEDSKIFDDLTMNVLLSWGVMVTFCWRFSLLTYSSNSSSTDFPA